MDKPTLTIKPIRPVTPKKVPKGTKIIALDENKILISEGDWHPEASTVIDFGARYVDRAGIDQYGNEIFGNRGFKYKDKGVIWDFYSEIN